VSGIARALCVSRSNLMREVVPRRPRQTDAREDECVVERLKAIVGERATYGYRRATVVLNRERRLESKSNVNHKRVYRLMRGSR
jgi:hypothetical protein